MAGHCDSVLERESTSPELDSRSFDFAQEKLRGNDNFKAGPCTLRPFAYGVNQCNSVSNPDLSKPQRSWRGLWPQPKMLAKKTRCYAFVVQRVKCLLLKKLWYSV